MGNKKKEKLEFIRMLSNFKNKFTDYLSQLEEVELVEVEKILNYKWVSIKELQFITHLSKSTLNKKLRFTPGIRQKGSRPVYFNTKDVINYFITHDIFFDDQNLFISLVKTYWLDIEDYDQVFKQS